MSTNIFEIFMQMGNFLILLWLMNKFLFRPLGAFLDKREDMIRTDLEQSETARKESETMLDDQKKLLNQARIEAKRIRDEADDAARKEREVALQQAKADAQQLLEGAKKEVDRNVDRAKQDLLAEVGRLSADLTGKILKRDMSSSDHDAVLKDYLQKVKP